MKGHSMAKGKRLGTAGSRVLLVLLFAACLPLALLGGATTRTNPPSECQAARNSCGCPKKADEGKKDDGTGTYSSCRAAGSCTADGPDVENGCIKIWLDLGRTTPWTGSMACSLKLFADDEASDIFYSESLYPSIGGYTFKRLGQKTMPDGRTPAEVVLNHPRGEPVHFTFRDGGSWGMPDPGVHVEMDERLMMVDAEGWATTSDPVYWDLYAGDGTRRRFLATDKSGRMGSLVSFTDARGVAATPQDMGVDLVYDGADLRQVLTPCRLAHVDYTADWTGYDISVYPLSGKPRFDDARGLYDLPSASPVSRLSVRPGKDGKRAVVTVAKGGGEPQVYTFDYLMGEWSLVRPSGVREEKERFTRDMADARIVKTVKSASKQVLSRRESNFKWESWGFAMTNRVEGFGGVTDTTTWTYYTSGNGKGQVKTEQHQSGLLIQYAYDNLDRKISETRSGPDMMTELTTYDYTPVDPSDPVLPVDTRPRTVVRKLNNIECERTYYVYSPLTNIVERVGTQGAAYGSTNVLRTVTAFYPVSGESGNGEPVGSSVPLDRRAGFVASIRHEDGKLDLYDYELASNVWTRTVTHLHEQSPAPVSGKTTRDVTITNARGEVLEERTEAFVDDAWHVIARERNTYNAEGKIVQRENLAGQVTTTAWDCCHKISETEPDGSTTTWDYDEEGRMIASSRLIPLDMTNVTWLTTCYEYDDLGRQVATWQTNYAAQVGLPATRTSYDQLGRVIARVGQLGNTTTTEYSSDGRTVSVLNPNTSTRVTTRSASGDTLSITGSAVTPEFHTYGILPDGTRWAKIVQGESAESPMFTKRYENMIGQTVREELSGFHGAVLYTCHSYDSLGRLASTDSDYEPRIEYSYDEIGNRVAATRSVEDEWRKTQTYSLFAIDDNVVWLTQTNIVSSSDATIAPLVSSESRQLTGLTSSSPLCIRSTDIRGNTTENKLTASSTVVISRHTVPYAFNKALEVSRFGIEVQDVSVSVVTNSYAYDGLGRRTAITDGRGNTSRVEYDAFGHRSASIDALGNKTTYAYDAFGNLAAITNPLGNTTIYEYDLRGRKIYEGGAIYPVRYTYDIFGNKSTMMTYRNESLGPDSGDLTIWLYDEASGSMTNKVYADGRGPTYTYTPDGKLSQRIWARGIVTDYAYDGWGNLTNTVYSDDTPTVSLSYDALGRQTEAHDAAGVTTFRYDIYGSLTNETVIGVTGTNTVERYWDAYGRTAGYALNDESQTTIGYCPATGRIESMLANGSTNAFHWSYVSGSDHKARLLYPNGLSASWQYDAEGQLLQVCNATPTNVISQYDYIYDAEGRRIGRHQSGMAFSSSDYICYNYNNRDELTNLVASVDAAYNFEYSYDDIGNRERSIENAKETAYSVNGLNQYTAIEGASETFVPQFDADGNQTIIKTKTGIWSATYNGENRPIYWSNGATNIVMSFDRMGRRVQCQKSADPLVHINESFSYNQYACIAIHVEKSDCNYETDRFIWDPTDQISAKPLVFNHDTFASLYYIHDGNKNISELQREHQDVLAHYEYSAYGQQYISIGTNAIDNPWRFSSEYEDTLLGLLYYNYRHFDAEVGRWLSYDIEELSSGDNLYLFVYNSPLDYIDEMGMRPRHHRKPKRRPRGGSKIKRRIIPPQNNKSCPTKCCNGKQVQLVPVWSCKRTLKWSDSTKTGSISWYHNITALYHQYLCCDGENQNCFGVHAGSKKGDIIPREDECTGACEIRCVCPEEKKTACSSNARMPENYHVGPHGIDCQEWVDGVTSSCAR